MPNAVLRWMGISDHADLGEREGQSNIMAIGRAGAGAPGLMKGAPKGKDGGGDGDGDGGGGKEKGDEGKEKEKPKPPRYY